jgi:two-component system response regulator LytT
MNILIVEDERVAARRLERIIREILGDKLDIIHCIETLRNSEIFLKQHPVDVLFLDLNLNGQDGFELLKSAVSESFQTIVVSANTDRAIEAYEYGVLDFVPKPFDKSRLIKAFERLERVDVHLDHTAKVLVVRNQSRLQIIPVEQVKYLQGAGDYAEVHLHSGMKLLHNKSLEALMKILPNTYVRIHKSYITDLNYIVNLRIYGGGKYECELKDGTVLPVSRTRYKELIEYLEPKCNVVPEYLKRLHRHLILYIKAVCVLYRISVHLTEWSLIYPFFYLKFYS